MPDNLSEFIQSLDQQRMNEIIEQERVAERRKLADELIDIAEEMRHTHDRILKAALAIKDQLSYPPLAIPGPAPEPKKEAPRHRQPKEFTLDSGQTIILSDFHDDSACEGQGCWVHHPSDHHMVGWDLNWREDLRIMERVCKDGIGHPDPDDLAYRKRANPEERGTHGCDGCCVPPKAEEREEESSNG